MPIYKHELTSAEKQRDKMLRYEYATYIMLCSYFKKSSISNPIIEERYKLNYAAIAGNKQADLEEIVIQMVDEVLIPKLNKIKDMENKEIVMTPINIKDSDFHYLMFTGEGFKFTLVLKSVFDTKKRTETLYANFVNKDIK